VRNWTVSFRSRCDERVDSADQNRPIDMLATGIKDTRWCQDFCRPRRYQTIGIDIERVVGIDRRYCLGLR
jgi:hypothetical protein